MSASVKWQNARAARKQRRVTGVAPGDVIAVRTGGWAAWFIRLGAALRRLPHGVNHVVVAHHTTPDGVLWGIEGRPGGVGWVDCTRYITSPATVDNRDQPKTPEQRQLVCNAMVAAIGTPYDWTAIATDAADDLGLPDLWSEDWHSQGVPGHVVCSSVASWAYWRAGLDDPPGGRRCQPGDWAAFITTRAWNRQETPT